MLLALVSLAFLLLPWAYSPKIATVGGLSSTAAVPPLSEVYCRKPVVRIFVSQLHFEERGTLGTLLLNLRCWNPQQM